MKLTALLVKIGLVYGGGAPPESPSEPPSPISTRQIDLEELRRQDRQERGRGALAALGLDKTFAEIYRESGIGDPPSGVCLEDLDRLVAGLPVEEARLVVMATLQEKGAPIREVLLDGQRRDQALDAYEQALEERVAEEGKGLEQQAADLLRQARDLESRARDLQGRVPELQQALQAWKKRKHEEEDLMELLGSMLVNFQEPPSATTVQDLTQAGGGAGPAKSTPSES